MKPVQNAYSLVYVKRVDVLEDLANYAVEKIIIDFLNSFQNELTVCWKYKLLLYASFILMLH